MSEGRETEVLTYAATLLKEQRAVILAGRFTQIEEYRAACAVTRNLERIIARCEQIIKGRDAAEVLAEDGLTEMPETETA
jgi:phosphate uptake regulator